MTKEQPPDKSSPDPLEGAGSGAISDQELDDVLAQASSLADDLAEEVGLAEKSDQQGEPHEPPDGAADLDAELSELEQLVADASSEVNEEAESADETAPSAEESTPRSEKPPIPDFMEEFTRPQEPADAEPAATKTPASTAPPDPATTSETKEQDADASGTTLSAKPGVVGTGMIGVVGAPLSTPPTDDRATEGTEASDTAAPTEEDDTPETASYVSVVARLVHTVKQSAGRFSTMGLTLCNRALGLLEVVDRPFARLGEPVRRVIGWIAIATVGTAVIVYMISLF